MNARQLSSGQGSGDTSGIDNATLFVPFVSSNNNQFGLVIKGTVMAPRTWKMCRGTPGELGRYVDVLVGFLAKVYHPAARNTRNHVFLTDLATDQSMRYESLVKNVRLLSLFPNNTTSEQRLN